MAIVEHFGGSRPRFFVQRPLQRSLLVTRADTAYGLGRERDYLSDSRCAGTHCQLQQSQDAKDNQNLLDTRRSRVWQALFDASARCQISEVDDPYFEYAPKQLYITMVFTRSSKRSQTWAVE